MIEILSKNIPDSETKHLFLDRLEKAVRDVVHKAFWDGLQEQLSQNPPQYDRALSLLGEIKEVMYG